MGDIIAVDFKSKTKQHKWVDDYDFNVEKIDKIEKRMILSLRDMQYICGDDKEYLLWVSKTLGEMILNLRERI